MRLFNHSIAAFVGLGLLSAGCAGESIDDDLADAPSLTPMGGGGTLGQNGLNPIIFQPLRSALGILLTMPLTVNGQLNTDMLFSNFLAQTYGAKVFGYAVGCALPVGVSAGGYPGAGLMTTTSSWLTAPLSIAQQGDVMTCIETRLNTSGATVNIWIGGPDTAKTADDTAFPYFEALWTAKVSSLDGSVRYKVWPSDTFLLDTLCRSNLAAVSGDLNTRLCDNDPTLCTVDMGVNMVTDCTGMPGAGNWYCDGLPAIETRLTSDEFDLLNPMCKLRSSADYRSALCGRGPGGVSCALVNGMDAGASTVWQPAFSDANGWNIGPQYYSTIKFPDVNGDGKADLCGRGGLGINCAISDGTTKFGTASVWHPSFSDANGWGSGPQYYSTIQFPDLDGNGKADVCGRGGLGINCAISDGTKFGTVSVWQSAFSDANGFSGVSNYSTIQFPDLDGNGKADICGRSSTGIKCAISTGTGFGAATTWQASFNDTNGWSGGAQYYSTIQFADIDGDGFDDVCGRGNAGMDCALSTGTSFGPLSVWQSSFADVHGWASAQYYSTIKLADVDGDGKADVCGRGVSGLVCALSNGTSFGPLTLWQPGFSNANGWGSGPEYYSTIEFVDLNRDGKADVCGRGPTGLQCSLSSGAAYGALGLLQPTFSDAAGWNSGAQYYSTIHAASQQ